MIPVSQATKDALKAPVKQVRAKVEWATGMSTTDSITSEDSLVSLKKEAEGYYCESTLRKITIVAAGTGLDLLDKKVTVTIEVKTGANTWGSITWGSFNISEMTVNQAQTQTTFIGYGGIYRLQQTEYNAGELSFPTTVKGLAEQIAARMGITIETDLTTLPNYDAPIPEDLWAKINGTTYRDILEQIAGATGTIAVIGRGNDQLNFDTPPIGAATETLTETNLITSTVGEKWGVVNAVVLSRQPQNDNIELVDQQSVTDTGQRTDMVIANNEILDYQRETAIIPLLANFTGWEYRNGQIKTEGHGYHEIGDRIDVTVAGATHKMIVTKSVIIVDGGINETLTSKTPDQIPINYSKSGGITKTIYNTELAVDKQEQRIDAIVSRQDATDAAITEQFTQVTQDINGITATVQQSGGGNIIKNSGTLTVWEYGTGADTTTVKSQSSPASLSAGAVSGYEIMMTGASEISQNVVLTPGETYTMSVRAQKGLSGSGSITIANGTNSASITFDAGTSYTWRNQSVEFTPAEGANTVTLSVDASTTIEMTDLMLATGGKTTWRQASGEIYNTQVSLDQAGVQVRSSVYTGDYVEITPLEFAGYSNAGGVVSKVFSLNRDTTEVEKLEARSQIKMPPLKIVPIDNVNYSGWALVKEA